MGGKMASNWCINDDKYLKKTKDELVGELFDINNQIEMINTQHNKLKNDFIGFSKNTKLFPKIELQVELKNDEAQEGLDNSQDDLSRNSDAVHYVVNREFLETWNELQSLLTKYNTEVTAMATRLEASTYIKHLPGSFIRSFISMKQSFVGLQTQYKNYVSIQKAYLSRMQMLIPPEPPTSIEEQKSNGPSEPTE